MKLPGCHEDDVRALTTIPLETLMPDDELTLQVPGDDGATAAAPTKKSRATAAAPTKKSRATAAAAVVAEDATQDDSAGRIAQLEQQLAQAQAMIEQLMDAQGADTAASPPAAKEVRTIGDDWTSMTSAQAKASGVTKTVLCSDGYYVP